MGGDASSGPWAIAQTILPNTSSSPTIELERWDGTRWSLVASQKSASAFVEDEAKIQVVGPNDVWMSLPTTANVVISHWNGTALSTTGLPALNGVVPRFGYFRGTADNDLWFAGNVGSPAMPYVAHHSSSWGLYNTSLINNVNLNDIVDFRPGYALMLAVDHPGNPHLFVYNGYVRWREAAANPFGGGSGAPVVSAAVKGTTSFWTTYSAFNVVSVALVQCPTSPPAPL
jgi:hypothetical protein